MAIVASLVVIAIYIGVKKDSLTKKDIILSILFILYLGLVISQIVGFPSFSELNRITKYGESAFSPNLNLIPFSEGIDISSILNIILFIPLGYMLPRMWNIFEKLMPTFLFGLILSLIIEFGQLFTPHRVSDVDDLIMNTLGVIIGWFLYRFFFKNQVERKMKNNWGLYTIIVLICCFFF